MDAAALRRRSIEIIREGQAPTGAYLACPEFPPYRYCWFRDGAFVAEAMSRVGEVESAEAFFDWCALVLEPRADAVAGGETLHARYTADGEESAEEWSTFQLDGYGLWLWALARHCERHGRDEEPWLEAIGVTHEYLLRHWDDPCVDWWEEREGVHAATLACVLAGLEAVDDDEAADAVAEALGRATNPLRVDASALVLLAPLGLCGADDPLLEILEVGLVSDGGGVWRYLGDTYYGGGEWLLLTAMLGLAHLAAGRVDDARAKLDWVVRHAEPDGRLPEQAQEHLQEPREYERWVERWGPPASPLLWSHAMFLLLDAELQEAAA